MSDVKMTKYVTARTELNVVLDENASLRAELEKARYERDAAVSNVVRMAHYRDKAAAQRDAANALLREALPWVGHMSDNPSLGLRTRITAHLEQRP